MHIEKLVIIGSGPAGLTAAIYASRANLNPLVIEGNKPGGQLTGTSHVENWPGSKSILGPNLMAEIRDHAVHFGTRILAASVTKVNFSDTPFLIYTDDNQEIAALSVIIATGATPKTLKVPGENEYWGKGITTCAVCDGAFYKNKSVLIIGGGDTAMEDASYLKRFTDKITIVHILDKFTASHAMQERVINDSKINIIYNSTVTEFNGNGNFLTSATITNQQTQNQQKIDIDGAFIAIGLKPNTDVFKDSILCNSWGYIAVHDQVHTSVKGVFAAGDVHDYRYRQAITSAGAGCMAALEAERYISSL